MSDLVARALNHAASHGAPSPAAPGALGPSWVPGGPPARTRSGISVVHLRQTHGGVPVLGAVRSVRFDPVGGLSAFTGRTVTVAPTVPFRPAVDARDAAYAAARHLAGGALAERHPAMAARVSNRRPRVLSRSSGPEAVTTLRKIPFRDPVVASLGVLGDGSRLAWVVRFRLPAGGGAWEVAVDAQVEPRVLGVERSSAHAVTALVFLHDPDTPRVVTPFPLPRETYPDFGGSVIAHPEWCADSLTGNNAFCEDGRGRGLDAVADGDDFRFEPDDPEGLEQAKVNAFYLANMLHDFFYLLGFDEAAGNFQMEGDPAVGGGRDPLLVIVWDEAIPGLAFFVPHRDGFVSELQLGMRDGRHAALDAGVVIHEFVHGVTSRVVGGPDEPDPLRHPQSRALGEGYSDYFALTLRNRALRADGLPETLVYGAWISGHPDTGLRNFAYDEDFPGTYGMLGQAGFEADHDAGQVWCAALLDLNRALAPDGSPDVGDERGWQLVFDSLRLLHPGREGPTFLHARDALLDEFRAAVAAGHLPQDPALEAAVMDAFARRGMGPAARSPSAGFHTIVEDRTLSGGSP